MNTSLRKAAQMALDALELLARYENPSTKVQVRKPRDGGPIVTMYPHKVATEAAMPLRARLAQPEPEPVVIRLSNGEFDVIGSAIVPIGALLYTASPQRGWQGLTDEEIENLYLGAFDEGQFARAIEAKLKEKNA